MLKDNMLIIILFFAILTCMIYTEVNSKNNSQKNDNFSNTCSLSTVEKIDVWKKNVDSELSSYKKITKDIFGQSTEGGAVTGYFKDSVLVKITAVFFGETGRTITEYYLCNGNLRFVLNEEQLYDKPISEGNPEIVKRKQNKYYIAQDSILQWIDENFNTVKNDGENYVAEIKYFINDVEEYRNLLKSGEK